MFKSLFADHNEEVRQEYIEKYGQDINAMTPKEKARFLKVHGISTYSPEPQED